MYPLKEPGPELPFFFWASLRRQKRNAPMKSAMRTIGTITAAAMAPPLVADLLLGAAVELVSLGSEVALELVEAEVEVGCADIELNSIPVKTICSLKSVGWPLNDVSTDVASVVAPHPHCKNPPG